MLLCSEIRLIKFNFCFPDTDECASDPCLNGSTCVDRLNQYNCICDAVYAGTHCETGIFPRTILKLRLCRHISETEWSHLNITIPVSTMPSIANLSLLCFNLNPSRDKWLHLLWSVGWNDLSIPELQRLHHWSLKMDKYFHPTLYWACDYLSMLGLELNHVSKWSPGRYGTP